MTWIQAVALLIDKYPEIEAILVKVFAAYMKQKHRIEIKDFLEAEQAARKGDTTKLREMFGRKLR